MSRPKICNSRYTLAFDPPFTDKPKKRKSYSHSVVFRCYNRKVEAQVVLSRYRHGLISFSLQDVAGFQLIMISGSDGKNCSSVANIFEVFASICSKYLNKFDQS